MSPQCFFSVVFPICVGEQLQILIYAIAGMIKTYLSMAVCMLPQYKPMTQRLNAVLLNSQSMLNVPILLPNCISQLKFAHLFMCFLARTVYN